MTYLPPQCRNLEQENDPMTGHVIKHTQVMASGDRRGSAVCDGVRQYQLRRVPISYRFYSVLRGSVASMLRGYAIPTVLCG